MTMLPLEYKEALQALKDQASSVTNAISTRTSDRPVGLGDAQRRMSARRQQVNIIVNLTKQANKGRSVEDMLTIPDLTEGELHMLLWENGLVERP